MKTSLYDEHIKLNAKMVDFVGFEMPVNYLNGINQECKSVRNDIGIFDVSQHALIISLKL